MIVGKLGPKFQFGPYELEDLEGEALVWINDKFDRYDPERKGKNVLFNFMYTLIRNKLYNLKRNQYSRLDPPCTKCPFKAFVDGECQKYENLQDCKYYAKWLQINSSKEQLMSVCSADDSRDDSNLPPLEAMVISEDLKEIWESLPDKQKKTMEDILSNEKVNKVRFANLVKECQWLLENNEYTPETPDRD